MNKSDKVPYVPSQVGIVYVWGKGNYKFHFSKYILTHEKGLDGQLGLGSKMVDEPFPQEVTTLSNAKIRHLACGGSFTVAISGKISFIHHRSTNQKMVIATLGVLLKPANSATTPPLPNQSPKSLPKSTDSISATSNAAHLTPFFSTMLKKSILSATTVLANVAL